MIIAVALAPSISISSTANTVTMLGCAPTFAKCAGMLHRIGVVCIFLLDHLHGNDTVQVGLTSLEDPAVKAAVNFAEDFKFRFIRHLSRFIVMPSLLSWVQRKARDDVNA